MLYPLSYEGKVPICRDFTSATAGPEYQSCEKVAKFAGDFRAWLREVLREVLDSVAPPPLLQVPDAAPVDGRHWLR